MVTSLWTVQVTGLIAGLVVKGIFLSSQNITLIQIFNQHGLKKNLVPQIVTGNRVTKMPEQSWQYKLSILQTHTSCNNEKEIVFTDVAI